MSKKMMRISEELYEYIRGVSLRGRSTSYSLKRAKRIIMATTSGQWRCCVPAGSWR